MTESRGARISFMAFVGERPKVALSILIGAVAFCGLLNAILFFSAFNIPYRLYLGATDFVTVAVRSSPSVIAASIVLIVLALLLALAAWLVVEAAFWLSPKLAALHWRATPALLARAEIVLAAKAAGAFGKLLGKLLKERSAAHSSSDRARRAARAMLARPVLFRRARARHASGQIRRIRDAFRCWLRTALTVASCLDFADRYYREIFILATVLIALIGSSTSYLSALRVQSELKGMGGEGQRSSEAEDGSEQAASGFLLTPLSAVFDHFYVDMYLRPASANLASSGDALEGVVLLDSTTSHTFLYSISDGLIVVPTDAIEALAQSEKLPSALRKRPTEELPSSGELLARRIDEVAGSLNEIQSTLASVASSVAEPMVVAMAPAPEQTSKSACTELPGAEFVFEHDSDDLDVEEKERNRNAMQAVIGYFRSDQTVFARGDYVLVVGHADVSGDVVYNQRLSERRAQATVQRLLKILTVWIGPVADRMYPIAAGEGAKAWEEDPSTDRNRRALVYHCRRDEMADPDPSVADARTNNRGMNGHARFIPSSASSFASLEIN